jgi:deoxyribonuclease IV
MLLGAHVPSADPLGAAAVRGAEVAQVFLSSPRRWASPTLRADAAVLRASGLPLYVHSPYLLNLASADPLVRDRSQVLLQGTCAAAEAVGALGVVVHGGQTGAQEDRALGPARWRAALERLESSVPVLIEDTAGGPNAVASTIERIARLWAALDGLETPFGCCLDTCHLHAAGEALVAGTERLLALLGRIDLVHLNDSKDAAGSGRDRHENLGAGRIDPEALEEVVRLADAPTVVETPGGAAGQAVDIAWMRARVAVSTV